MGLRDVFRLPSPEESGGFLVNEAPGRRAKAPLWRRLLVGEQRALTPWDVYGDASPGTMTNSGTAVNETTAFKFSVVYASINLIADAVSSLPPQAFVEGEDGSLEPAQLPQWVRKPHPEIRRYDIWHQLMVSVLAWGNGYALFIRRPSDGVITGLSVLDPNEVVCEWDPNRPGFRRYKVGHSEWKTSADIMHVQGPTLPGRATGMSVIAQAREAIGLGLTLEEFGARYFGQGSQAKIVIELPGQGTVDESKAKAIVRTFERFHRGKGNWHRPALMTGGAKLHNISIPPEDAQFLQSREFQAGVIASWFRVPPHRVGLTSKSTSWGSGLAEENMAFLQHTIRPWILRMEGALTAYSPGGEGRGLVIKLGDDVLQRGTFKEAADTWGSLVDKGIATPNEARVKLGLKPMHDEEAADHLRDPGAGEPDDPRTKEDDRKRKQDEAAGRSARRSARRGASFRHGDHDQSSHGSWAAGRAITAGTRFADLSPKGQAAVRAGMEKLGVTHESLVAEMKAKITPETLEAGKVWYQEASEFNQDLAERSGLSYEAVTGITSAVSPRMKWEVDNPNAPDNKKIAEQIAMKHRDYDGMDAKAAAEKMGGALTDNMAQGITIARTGDAENLTGVKRRSFYNNMLDPANSTDVTVDTHMMKSVMHASESGATKTQIEAFLGASAISTKGGAGYVAISEAVHEVASDLGISPHQAQAAYWLAVQTDSWKG